MFTRFFDAIFGSEPVTRTVTVDLSRTEKPWFGIAVVGELPRQDALRRLATNHLRRSGEVVFTATLIPEPMNEYDSNAVRVCAPDGSHVGYLSALDAADYGTVFKLLSGAGQTGTCRAKLIGGTRSKPNIGVLLDLRARTHLAKELKTTGKVKGQP